MRRLFFSFVLILSFMGSAMAASVELTSYQLVRALESGKLSSVSGIIAIRLEFLEYAIGSLLYNNGNISGYVITLEGRFSKNDAEKLLDTPVFEVHHGGDTMITDVFADATLLQLVRFALVPQVRSINLAFRTSEESSVTPPMPPNPARVHHPSPAE